MRTESVQWLELVQFPVTARSRVGKADFQAHLYQASSRGGECNLARFGSSEPGLPVTTTLKGQQLLNFQGSHFMFLIAKSIMDSAWQKN